MGTVIILAIVIALVIIIKKQMDKAAEEKKAAENAQRRKQQELEKARKAHLDKQKYEKMTESEKNSFEGEEKALQIFISAFDDAVNGNASAMYTLGMDYTFFVHDYDKANYWLKKSADCGNSDALFQLGKNYMDGFGVLGTEQEKKKLEGANLIRKSAEKGNRLAIDFLLTFSSKEELRKIGIPV